MGLPGTVLGIPGYLVPWGLMPDGTSRDYPGYPGIIPGYLDISGPGTVLGIQGYLLSQDPWDSMPGRTSWDCLGYPENILSILGY